MFLSVAEAGSLSCEELFVVKGPKAVKVSTKAKAPVSARKNKKGKALDPRYLVDPIEIRNRAKEAWKGSVEDKARFLQIVENEMNQHFFGMESQIARMMTSVRSVIMAPAAIQKPIVIDMISVPGAAKTSMIKKLGELLSLNHRLNITTIKPGQVGIDAEVFHSMRDIDTKNTDHAPVAFLVLDEWQNLKSKDQLSDSAVQVSSSGNFNKDSTYVVDEFVLRKNFERLLNAIYGNAREQVEAPFKPQNKLAEIEDSFSAIKNARQSIDTVKNHVEKSKKGETDPNKLNQLDETAQRQILSYTEYLDNNFKEVVGHFKELRKYYEAHVETLSVPTVSELRSMDETQLKRLLEQYQGKLQDIPLGQVENTYFQMITFINANPEQALTKIRKEYTGDEKDSDAHSNFVKERCTPDVIQQELYYSKFGTDAIQIASRLNVDQWAMMDVFDSNDWKNFVHQNIRKLEFEFVKTLNLAGKGGPGTILKIDSSVEELLFAEAVNPFGGNRAYFDNQMQLVSSYFVNLTTRIVSISDKSIIPKQIIWKYDKDSRLFIVEGFTQSGKLILKDQVDVAKLKRVRGDEGLRADILSRQFANQAGTIAMVIYLTKALPKSFRIKVDPETWNYDSFWESGDAPRFSSALDVLRLALAGSLSQGRLKDTYDFNDPALVYAKSVLGELVEVLAKKELVQDIWVNKDKIGMERYHSNFPLPEVLKENPALLKTLTQALVQAEKAKGQRGSGEAKPGTAPEGSSEAPISGETKISEEVLSSNDFLSEALRILSAEVMDVLNSNQDLVQDIAVLLETKYRSYNERKMKISLEPKNGKSSSASRPLQYPQVKASDIEKLLRKNDIRFGRDPNKTIWARIREATLSRLFNYKITVPPFLIGVTYLESSKSHSKGSPSLSKISANSEGLLRKLMAKSPYFKDSQKIEKLSDFFDDLKIKFFSAKVKFKEVVKQLSDYGSRIRKDYSNSEGQD